jgi:hypothetical protein
MIYLASPYSHNDRAVMEMRWSQVCEASSNIMKEGKHLYSPIAHCHEIAKYGLPTDWGFWEQYDTEMIKRCDELWVLMLDGWTDSVGVRSEISIAESFGIPVTYIDVEEYVDFSCKVCNDDGAVASHLALPCPAFSTE